MTYPDKFKVFWKLWPGRWRPDTEIVVKVGKRKAFKEWKKISLEEQNEIIVLMKTGKVKRAGTQYLPDACRWLKEGGWDDFS